MAFTIGEAFADRMVIGASLGSYDQQQAAACFGAGFSFDIRSQGAYTVSGSYSGLRHGVRADAMTGRCEVLESVNSQGRALPGQPFDNGFISFGLSDFDESAPPEDNAISGLSLVVGSVPSQLGQNVGAAPAALRYLGLNEMLYSVDASGAGLFEIDLDGFTSGTALR